MRLLCWQETRKEGKLKKNSYKKKLENVADARWLTNPPHFTATSPVENYKQIPLQLQETNPRKYKKKMWPMRTG